MRRRLSFLVLLAAFAAATPLVYTGCGRPGALPLSTETEDPDYRRAKDLLRMGREQEALGQFLKLIDQRAGDAPESHLEVAIYYQKHENPIAAIYHYGRYQQLRPTTEQARLVTQSIDACIRDFARKLPARPLDNQVDRSDLMDAIDRLQRENLQLKEQLAGARAAVLETTRQSSAHGAGTQAGLTGSPTLDDLEPSQGGFLSRGGGTSEAVNEPDYSPPVGVVPITPTLRPPAPTSPGAGGIVRTPPPRTPSPVVATPAPTPAASGVRRHVVAKGDTLQSLSLRYYNTRTRFRDIYNANREVMPNEGTLRIGMELKIPQ